MSELIIQSNRKETVPVQATVDGAKRIFFLHRGKNYLPENAVVSDNFYHRFYPNVFDIAKGPLTHIVSAPTPSVAKSSSTSTTKSVK